MSITEQLTKRKLITPPKYVSGSIQYETLVGSDSYGVSTDSSDKDIYGFCIPPKSIIFPHLAGKIQNFGTQQNKFRQYQKHHINDKDTKCVWDISIYNIVRFFHLCMQNNPNMLDSLYTPDRCVLSITKIGQMVRNDRHLFLSKEVYFRYRGYAYSQLKKMRMKNPEPGSKRYNSIMKLGFDVKYAYHLVRLLNQAEQTLTEGTMDLQQSKEQLKSIRAGEWTVSQIEKYFEDKEKELETLYINSKLPILPPEDKIKELLLNCLEEFYGSLEGVIEVLDAERQALKEIDTVLDKIWKKIQKFWLWAL